jgi:hypothetical protein
MSAADTDRTWRPVDLTPYLDGTRQKIVPTLMPRSDDHCLLYAGKTHSFHGESESGKSLILMTEAVRIMKDGGDVLWITFDSDPDEDVMGRALAMGCEPETIKKHLDYVAPESGLTSIEDLEDFGALLVKPYRLAVIDGVTDATSLIMGATGKGDPNEAFTVFSRKFPRPLAKQTGAAVVMIDHVTKSPNGRGRFAIGAQAKMSQVTGAAYTVEMDDDNVIILCVAKDRPHGVRPFAGRMKDRLQEVARVTIKSDDHKLDLMIGTHADAMEIESAIKETQKITEFGHVWSVITKPMGKSEISRALKAAKQGIGAARLSGVLTAMESEGYLTAPAPESTGYRPFSRAKSVL